MKILVTGATGFIGNHVVMALLKMGCEVIATSRSRSIAEKCTWYKDVTYIPFNIANFRRSPSDLYRFFLEPDCLIDLAWTGLPNYHDAFHFEYNTPIHYSFIKSLLEGGLKQVVGIGTCLEYGLQSGCLKESAVTMPTTPYGIAKDYLNKCLQHLTRDATFQWVRLFYIYGEGQNSASLFPQLDRAVVEGKDRFRMSGGEQLRDYLPVENVAEYIAAIAIQKKTQGPINCCSGIPVSIRRLVEEYICKKGYKIQLDLGFYPYPEYESMAFWGDNAKLRGIIGKC